MLLSKILSSLLSFNDWNLSECGRQLLHWMWCPPDFITLCSGSGPRCGRSLGENVSLMGRAHSGAPQCGHLFSETLTSSFTHEGNILSAETGQQKWTAATSHSGYNPYPQCFSGLLGTTPQPGEASFPGDPVHHHPSLTDKSVKTPKRSS